MATDDDTRGAARSATRRWPYVIALLLVLVVAGSFAVREFVRPEKLTAMLVGEVRTRLGASLELGGNARFGVWPSLHVELPQAALRNPAATAPFLATESIDVVVPWRSLWGDALEIERIELDAPRLDLEALDAWLAARPAGGDMAGFSVRIVATDGSLARGAATLASGIDIDLASAGDLAAWLASDEGDPKRTLIPPLAGSIEAAEVQLGETRLRGVRIDIDPRSDSQPGETAAPRDPARP
jgi:hypothetical protein